MRHAIAATVAFFLCAALVRGLRPGVDRPQPGPPLSPPSAPPAEADAPSAAAAQEEDPGSLEDLLARLPPLERGRALAPIRGRVLLDGGIPVAGARVEARVAAPSASGLPFEQMVREWADEARAAREAPIAAATDATGWFELRGLLQASYRLEATHPDVWVVPARSCPGAETHRPGDTVEILARPGHPFELEIDVVGPGAGSPPEATIEIDLEDESPSAWAALEADPELQESPGDRAFLWSPSRRRLTVAWDGALVARGPGGSVAERVSVSPSDPRPKVTLRLAEPRGIAIEVRRPAGSEKVVTRAAVMSIDPERPPTLGRFERGARWLEWLELEEARDARVISDLPPGTYQVGVHLARPEGHHDSREHAVDGWTTVQVSSGPARARIEIGEPEVEGCILARVAGPDGRPLEDVELELWLEDETCSFPPRSEPTERDRTADGSYLVRPELESAIAAVAALAGAATSGGAGAPETTTLKVVATHRELGEASGRVLPGRPPVANVAFREPGRLEIVVAGTEDEWLLARVHVELRPRSETRRRDGIWLGAGTIGEATITHRRVPPGDYDCRVTFACGGKGHLELGAEALRVGSGETTRLAVRIPEVHPVEVRSASRHRRRALVVVGGDGLRCEIDRGARGEGLLLPPGSYEVRAWVRPDEAAEPPILTFRVPGQDAVEIPAEASR